MPANPRGRAPLAGAYRTQLFRGPAHPAHLQRAEQDSRCDRLVDHPRVLAVLDRLLMPNYLLSALQAINIQPGETAQLAHHDDGFYPIPRPRAPLAAATIWAVDDFTADNGATVVTPAASLAQASAEPRRSRATCRYARRLVRLLRGHPLAWRRR